MPTSTTTVNACGVSILLADEMGQMVDISGSSNEANIDFDNALGEYKAFGDSAMFRLECGTDGSIDFTAFYSRGLREAYDLLKRWRKLRGPRMIQINVPGNTAGADRYQAQVLYEKISLPLKSDEAKPIMVKASLKPNGYIDWYPIPG